MQVYDFWLLYSVWWLHFVVISLSAKRCEFITLLHVKKLGMHELAAMAVKSLASKCRNVVSAKSDFFFLFPWEISLIATYVTSVMCNL